MVNNKEEQVFIFDTTLRDGEQSPGASMSVQEKLELALQLERLGVDIIEAGFPVSSPAQMEAVQLISREVRGPAIAGLSRAVKGDLDAAAKAVGAAARGRIHTFIATSPIHMEYKLNKKPDQVLKMAVEAVKYARGFVDDVEFSAEDASRSEIGFLTEIVEAVIDAGATTVNIPDTTGYAVPDEYAAQIKALKERVRNIDKAVLSVHCHDDLGMAVANSIAGVQAGARQVEVSVNGIGERAGNAALEEIVMALRTRKDVLGLDTGITSEELYRTSKLLSSIIAMPIPANKAIIGKNAFAHESGIHQDGVLKERRTYEIMTPESIGRNASELVLGRHSGKHGFKSRLEELGYHPDEKSLDKAYRRFLEIADKKKEVFDDDLRALIEDEMHSAIPQTYKLKYVNFTSGNTSIPTATVVLEKDGRELQEAATGDGPVDAIYRAVDRITRIDDLQLEEYSLSAVTGGKDALGGVTVTVSYRGELFSGRGASTDVVLASGTAYVNAINRMLNKVENSR